MIIDSTYFNSYLEASKLTIARLDDPLSEFWLKDWFDDFPNKEKIFIHSFPQDDTDVFEVATFCRRHKDFAHVIILSGQVVPIDEFEKLVQEQDKIYILNDYGYSSKNFFPVISAHRTFGKGYLNKVAYTPWADRKYTLSSLSSRYEPHRWILTAHLNNLKRDDYVFSFHNAYPAEHDLNHFLATAKLICNFDVDDQMANSVQELIDRAPVIPAGMNNPRPEGKMNEMTHVYDQCELGVYINSKVNLTMEGQFVDTGYGCNITEKTLKCLATGCFPLHVGQTGFYKFLEGMGFEFDVDIDLSYDNLPGDNRQTKLKQLIDLTTGLEATQKMEAVCKNNYDWFHNNWFKYCERINQPVLHKLIATIIDEV